MDLLMGCFVRGELWLAGIEDSEAEQKAGKAFGVITRITGAGNKCEALPALGSMEKSDRYWLLLCWRRQMAGDYRPGSQAMKALFLARPLTR